MKLSGKLYHQILGEHKEAKRLCYLKFQEFFKNSKKRDSEDFKNVCCSSSYNYIHS